MTTVPTFQVHLQKILNGYLVTHTDLATGLSTQFFIEELLQLPDYLHEIEQKTLAFINQDLHDGEL